MFKSASFAPLDSECYNEENVTQPEQQLSACLYGRNQQDMSASEKKSSPRSSSQGKMKEGNDSSSSTGGSSGDDAPEDEFCVRRLSSSDYDHNDYPNYRTGSGSFETDVQRGDDRRKLPPLDPQVKRLIRQLLSHYEEVEQMYKDEKFRHALALKQLSVSKTRSDASKESRMQISETGLYPADDHLFVSGPQLSHARSSSRLKDLSLAPDPPAHDAWEVTYPQFILKHLVKRCAEDGDIDDLASHHVEDLIDGDVDSSCKAVKEHNQGRQYLRDIILGVNDGLVSTFLLVAGVRGGGFTSRDILLSAIAGSVAGAVSMCAGEYVATKSQNELTKGEIATERRHIRDHLKDELMEVSNLLELIGIGEEHRSLQKALVRHYARDHEALLKINVALELGFLEEEERSPIMAGMVSFFLFLIGAFPSVFPFMIPDIDPDVGFIVAGVTTCISLLIVGAVKTWATKGNCFSSGMENLCVAGFGGAVAYGAGALTAMFIDHE